MAESHQGCVGHGSQGSRCVISLLVGRFIEKLRMEPHHARCIDVALELVTPSLSKCIAYPDTKQVYYQTVQRGDEKSGL